jgi:hypothetical protein
MNNLLTEVSRIQEIIGLKKSIINEGAVSAMLGKTLSSAVEKEILQVIRKEVAAALKNGVKAADVYAGKTSSNIEKEVLQKAGLKSLTGPQKAGLKAESIRIAKFQADRAAKRTATQTAKKETAVAAAQNINKNFNKNTVEVLVKLEGKLGPSVKRASKAGSKNAKTVKGGTKNLKRPALSEQQVLDLDKAVTNGAKEQIEQEAKRDSKKSWANWVKWGKRIGIGAGVLWLLWYFMSDDGTPVPDDITPTPNPSPNPNPNPNPGGNFKDCENEDFQTYGCKSSFVRRVQECIGGLVVDGIWGRRTNTKLANLGYASGFESKDVETICSKALSVQDGNKPAPTPTPESGTSDRGKEGAQDMGGDSQSQQDQGQQVSFDPNAMD